jgi:superfamily II DNA/RNA helicase
VTFEIQAVTGRLPEETRRTQVEELGRAQRRLLVATDCLSEGINLQEHFDAVVHYDLPWNPNRIQQREGRVDRYGHKKRRVRTVLLYGSNNAIDLHVLEVLVRKANTIRSKHGLSVAAPLESDSVIEALIGSVILEGRGSPNRVWIR